MLIKKINVFTKDPNLGNPAAVVVDFTGDRREMQTLAKKMNMPVTVFVLPPEPNSAANIKLSFFGVAGELVMCGHGILAATSYLFANTQEGELCAEIGANAPIKIRKRKDGLLQFDACQADRLDIPFNHQEVCTLLGILNTHVVDEALPYCIATIGSPKLLIPIKNRQILLSLKPNYAGILAWSHKVKVNGFYAYTRDVIESSSTFHARSFNPGSGNNEDAATGVAAAALASIYARKIKFNGDIIIEQGDSMHRSSRLVITVDKEHLKIGGSAVDKLDNCHE